MKIKKIFILEIAAMVLFIIYMIPFVLVIMNASKPSIRIIADPIALPENPMQIFTNIKTVFVSPNVRYPASFITSFIITVISVVLLVLISSMAAWVLVRYKTKLSGIIFLVFVSAMVIPFQVVMFPLVSWFRMIEVALGLTGSFRLLQNYPGIIFAYLGFGCSLSIFLFHGFIKTVPLELEEAATIDGCSKPAVFFKIVFPILTPITVTVIILNSMWIWNDFLLPLLVLGGGNKVQTLPLGVANFVGSFLRRWDLILTSTLMAMLPVIILFLFLQKYIIKGIVDGAVKG
ncbi:MAG: carbohydrate ABC transporter permease [Treponema sp.]|jgi:raffinose/stachyose/melibiose transport system permease protein|nr:carbohydrate ABC transporter permease [Treponema sp.]